MFRRVLTFTVAAVAFGAITGSSAQALSLTTIETKVASPTALAFRPNSPWPVVTQRNGLVIAITKGKASVLADLTDRVGQQGGERGLLGIAYSPLYKDNGFVFVNYTDATGDTQIVRFRRGKYGHFLKRSATTLLSIRQPYANHNGGQLAFGPDGFLYIGIGDGGSGGDPGNRAQNPKTLLGKILRIDVNSGTPYAIPPTNPFADGARGQAPVWAMGVRNPGFSFDTRTGNMWIVDPSQGTDEEVDWIANPAPPLPNLGWRAFDGAKPYTPQPLAGTVVKPLTSYGTAYGCNPVAGAVYRGKSIRKLRGNYVFGDSCSGRIWSVLRTDAKLVDTGLGVPNLAAIGQDPAGELWLISQQGQLSTITP